MHADIRRQMMSRNNREEIQPGMPVLVVQKQDQGTGKLGEGTALYGNQSG